MYSGSDNYASMNSNQQSEEDDTGYVSHMKKAKKTNKNGGFKLTASKHADEM